jgi:ADP-ribose pyrophosphatase
MDEQMHLFLAEGLSEVGAAREPGEQIENLIVQFSEAVDMVFRGEIRDAKTIVGLLYCQKLRHSQSAN